jgi:hypothetical protein
MTPDESQLARGWWMYHGKAVRTRNAVFRLGPEFVEIPRLSPYGSSDPMASSHEVAETVFQLSE